MARLNPWAEQGGTFPCAQGPFSLAGFSHLPFLGLAGNLSTVLMLLAEEPPREVLGCQASLVGSVPLEEMDSVQTRDVSEGSMGWGPWERGTAQGEVTWKGPVCI